MNSDSRPIADYDIQYVEIPSQPDVDRLILIPLQTVFINLAAISGANVVRAIMNEDDPLMRMLMG